METTRHRCGVEGMTDEKRCSKCREIRPTSGFYRDKKASDGLKSWCKACFVRQSIARKRAHPEKVAEEYRQWASRNPKAVERKHNVYRKRHPSRERIRHTVRNAVRDGRLEKPKRCQDCGRAAQLHGHHRDLLKALEVEWLCSSCHGKRHRSVIV